MDESSSHDVAFCPHCGNEAPQRHVGTHSRLKSPDSVYYTLVACETCDHATLYRDSRKRSVREAIYDVFTLQGCAPVWPAAGVLGEDVPKSVAKVYREAHGIKRRAPNAFANQIRRALEAVCTDRQIEGRTLADKLKRMFADGVLPPPLVEMTDVLRVVGNRGSHASEEEVEPHLVDPIDDFFLAVIEYVYLGPARIAAVKEGLSSPGERGG